MQVRDPRTVWVSPCGEYAIALCTDMPYGVMRMPNRNTLGRAIDSFGDRLSYTWRANDPISESSVKYYAVCRRLDLPWECPTVCSCGARVPVAIAAIGGRHLCKT